MAKKSSRGDARDTGKPPSVTRRPDPRDAKKPPREGATPRTSGDVRETGKVPPDLAARQPTSGDPRDTKTPPADGTGQGGAPGGNPLAGLDPNLINGIPTPPVAPFLTPEQMQALSTATRDYNIQINDLDYALGIQRIDTAYQQGELDKQATAQTSSTNDDMIRRGLFQSSIRDGALADITGTNATSKARLNDLLTAATIHTDTSERVLGHALDDMRQNYNVLATQNAADAGKDQNPWLLEPQKPPAAGTGTPGTTSPGGSTGRDPRDTGTPRDGGPGTTTSGRDPRDTGIPPDGTPLDPGTQRAPLDVRDLAKPPKDKPITMSASGHVAVAKRRMRGRA